jgi:hypothetical protein
MAEPLVIDMMDDLTDRLKYALPELYDRITFGPPEGIPTPLCIWVEYGPKELDYGLMEVATHHCRIVVSVPRQGDYPGEYRTVTAYAQQVHWALRGDAPEAILADEAVITGLLVNPAGGAGYAGQPDVLVTAVVDLTIETKQQAVPEVI